MNFHQLEIFVRVVEEKSFTKAAKKLFLSQPALSKSIRTLEEDLGTKLFERSAYGLEVTEAGNLVYKYSKAAIEYYNDRIAEMRTAISPQKNILRIGIPPSAGTIFFSKLVYRFGLEHPQFDIQVTDISSRNASAMVQSDMLDLGVVLLPFEDEATNVKCVYSSEAALVVPEEHPLASREQVAFKELEGLPFLSVNEEYQFYDLVLSKFKEAGITPNVAFRSAQWDTLLFMTSENVGYTILEKSLVERMNSGKLRAIHLTEPEFPWKLGLIRKKGKALPPAAQRFWEHCPEV